MEVHHLFIFTDKNGAVADELVAFGLAEGSNRVHVGQGTANRKFYFKNFYLEILWVNNEAELKSEGLKPTGLWQRAEYKTTGFSPFGLCLVNNNATDTLFKQAFKYQPPYFPEDLVIDLLNHDDQPTLPWTFRLPFKGQSTHDAEPTQHTNKISSLTKTAFECEKIQESGFTDFFNSTNIEFLKSSRTWLTLTFDNGRQGQTKQFDALKLTIQY